MARAQATPAAAGAPDPTTAPVLVESRGVAWPLMLDVHALIGVEPHDRGNPIAFGAGTELLWRARIGGFAALLASEGTPIIAPSVNGTQKPGFGDRISEAQSDFPSATFSNHAPNDPRAVILPMVVWDSPNGRSQVQIMAFAAIWIDSISGGTIQAGLRLTYLSAR